MIQPAILFGAALAASLLGMGPLIRKLSRSRVLDIPNARSSHDRPVPRGGGIGIVAPLLLGVAVLRPLDASGSAGFAWALLLGVSGLAVLGFLDDVYTLGALRRLLVQGALAAGCLAVAGLRLDELALPGLAVLPLGAAGWLVSWLFVVGFTNMFNFMDGINGIAGAQTLIGAAGLAALGVVTGDPALAAAMALLAGGSVGFLRFNFPRARVFMGDVGSLPLGFALALGVLQARLGGSPATPVPFWLAALFIWPFLFEATFTLVGRLLSGHNPFRAHRSHLYQRFVMHGWSHTRVTLGYAGSMVVCVGAAFACLLGCGGTGQWATVVFWTVAGLSLAFSLAASRRIVTGLV